MPPINSLRNSKPIMRKFRLKASKIPPLKASRRMDNPLKSEQRMTVWKDQYSPPETTNIIRAVFIEFKTV